MTTVYDILYTQLLKDIPFEEKFTNFMDAWRSHYRFSSGITKTFPVATFELFLKLAGGGATITRDTLLQGGCKSVHLADALHTLLGNENATEYDAFAKRLAVLPHEDLHCMFEAFCCEMLDTSLHRILSTESPDNTTVTAMETTVVEQHETNTNTNTERRYWWWQRYKCLCPFKKRRNTWY